MRTRSTITLSALLVLAGCGSGSGEGLDAGGQPAPPPAAPPPPPPPPASNDFQTIQDTIFTPICTACHIGANAPRGLRLDAANSFALLVNVASVEVPNLLRVNPGNPDQSYIVQKIEGTAAVGGRMPLGGAPLSQAQIDLVRGWIAAGAQQSAAPPAGLTVVSTIPAAGESAVATSKLTVIFSGPVDASLAGAGVFELRDGMEASVGIARAEVPAGRPNVVELVLARPLASGSYSLDIRGSGTLALADESGRVLDGDGDGASGGDFRVSFDVVTGGAR
jgi:methionine-rich copper-binding protein CopC